tara:strand:- start:4528 stop:4875 length:348 start_codon:yes stop_codon:yes gene_type:complete
MGKNRCRYTCPSGLKSITDENANRIDKRIYYLRNREKLLLQNKKWNKANLNKEKERLRTREISKKAKDNLEDSYIIKILIQKNSALEKLSTKEIPQELIELKRKQLKLYRYGKET